TGGGDFGAHRVGRRITGSGGRIVAATGTAVRSRRYLASARLWVARRRRSAVVVLRGCCPSSGGRGDGAGQPGTCPGRTVDTGRARNTVARAGVGGNRAGAGGSGPDRAGLAWCPAGSCRYRGG